jgi:hypothetical protein
VAETAAGTWQERYLVWKIERKQPNYFDGGGTCCSLHPSSRGLKLEEENFVFVLF